MLPLLRRIITQNGGFFRFSVGLYCKIRCCILFFFGFVAYSVFQCIITHHLLGGFNERPLLNSVSFQLYLVIQHVYASVIILSFNAIQVSNHVAAIDDPFVIASLLPPNVMLDARNLRWTLCATDRCFSNPVLSAFFRCVKVLPVSRGDGIYQQVSCLCRSSFSNCSDALSWSNWSIAFSFVSF